MSRNGGILSGGFNGLRAPSAPAITGVTTSIGSASVAFTPPTDVGDAAVSSYVVTAVDESTGASTGATGSASPITVTPPAGGTFKIRMQALNAYGPGRLTEYDTGNLIYSGAALYAWGGNTQGQLGLNDVASRSSPVQVGALTNWSKVSGNKDSGNYTSASVKTDDSLWTWGGQTTAAGVLGIGLGLVSRSSPVQVGALTNWSSVSVSRFMLALKKDGTLWSWGTNNQGQLGQNDAVDRSSPVQIGALTNWSAVATPFLTSLAVKTDGTLWSWGFNGRGNLGDNSTVPRSSPVQVGALTNWSQITGGGYHSAALKTDGTLWTWGRNNYGGIGDNTIIDRSSPVQIGALTNWAKIDAGVLNIMSIKTDGTLWAWGSNSSGALGVNSVINRSSPVQVGALTNWYSVNTNLHATSIKTDGTLWAWGGNGDGRLGDGTIVNKSSPVQIGSGTNWWASFATRNGTTALYGVV